SGKSRCPVFVLRRVFLHLCAHGPAPPVGGRMILDPAALSSRRSSTARQRPLHALRCGRIAFATLSLLLLSLAFGSSLLADPLTGTVQDPSGLPVAGAKIEISGENLSQPLVLTTDQTGRFSAPDLKPGKYAVQVAKDGFQPLSVPVEL